MRVCAHSYGILCHVRLISLGGLLFSEGKWRSSGSGGERRLGELAGRGGAKAILYESTLHPEVRTYCMKKE